ncbi:hypothetical protein Plhal703r1_c27g0110751 [Plasmopara halstedii]
MSRRCGFLKGGTSAYETRQLHDCFECLLWLSRMFDKFKFLVLNLTQRSYQIEELQTGVDLK